MVRRWFSRWRDVRLRNKLLLSFVLTVFIPVTMVGVFLTHRFRQMELRDAIEQTALNMERIEKRTEEVLKVAGDLSFRLLFDERLARVVNTRYETVYDVVRTYREYFNFDEFLQFNPEIAGIRIYMDNPTLINNWEFIRPNAAVTQSVWYRAAVEAKGRIGWFSVDDEPKSPDSRLSLVRRVDFPRYRSYGVLVVDIDTDRLSDILHQEPFETMLVEDGGHLVASNRENEAFSLIGGVPRYQALAALGPGAHEVKLDGRAYRVIVDAVTPMSSFNRLHVVSLFAVSDIVRDANRISMLGLVAMLASLGVAVVLIFGFSYALSRRLLALSKQISKVALGNLEPGPALAGNDELGQISRQFNSMLDSLRELMEEVRVTNLQKSRLELRQNEMKLRMMASQIHPHFLFNALESIRMKAHVKGEAEIAHVVKTLGRLMRKKLEIGASEIPLCDEIEMVRCYLEIQNFRYESRLRFEILVDPSCENVPIPPLVIQPLVENAVVHGLEKKEGGGTVRVRAVCEDGRLCAEVADDGVGIAADKLEALRRSLDVEEGEEPEDADARRRIGLRNVHQRLRLLYGESSGLAIDSRPGEGTKVRFSIPLDKRGQRHVQRLDRR